MSEENTNIDKKSTFCILPYIHAQTKPNGQIKPCCRFAWKDSSYKTNNDEFKFDKLNVNLGVSYTQAINSPEWEEIRVAMENNQKVPGCWKCYEEEEFADKNGEKAKSMRVKVNWFWNRNNQRNINLDGKSVKGQIRYLELALGTYCNLKCRTCTSDLSSTWVEDENILSEFYDDRKWSIPVVTVKENWDIRDFEHVEELKFTGGEPMLHPNFIKIIDIIISTGRANQITLDIYTNASWVPRAKVLDRLKQFKTVIINLSIDGIEKVNDYIRAPSQWEIVEKSAKEWIKSYIQHPNVYNIKWAPCINIYNIWQLAEMIDWWCALQMEIKNKNLWESVTYINSTDIMNVYQMNMTVNLLHEPTYLAISQYPDKDSLINKLHNHRDKVIEKLLEESNDINHFKTVELHFRGFYNKVIGALNKSVDKSLLNIFIEYTADLDKLRNQDLRKEIPELWNVLKDMVEYKGRIK
jgi:sulfatase maturation enzyme AslB (radical SAM superfamily)